MTWWETLQTTSWTLTNQFVWHKEVNEINHSYFTSLCFQLCLKCSVLLRKNIREQKLSDSERRQFWHNSLFGGTSWSIPDAVSVVFHYDTEQGKNRKQMRKMFIFVATPHVCWVGRIFSWTHVVSSWHERFIIVTLLLTYLLFGCLFEKHEHRLFEGWSMLIRTGCANVHRCHSETFMWLIFSYLYLMWTNFLFSFLNPPPHRNLDRQINLFVVQVALCWNFGGVCQFLCKPLQPTVTYNTLLYGDPQWHLHVSAQTYNSSCESSSSPEKRQHWLFGQFPFTTVYDVF